ncbi:hypothetical protein IE81DRAFT_357499 [Ceraceosorus guamensis]|uniref:Uncharacterized protein n=1 Tax=Ceraceosorus guamensis TaxID=1522189 RepID=A0A316VXQ9_9BASI|nr:hypothetical protein IE81DRAFT_357499 [Ceraceosorus guamensis]PWN42104.1 hypothetical protein IE81DRAFT_357499 [Ceraceosorus guamensis]
MTLLTIVTLALAAPLPSDDLVSKAIHRSTCGDVPGQKTPLGTVGIINCPNGCRRSLQDVVTVHQLESRADDESASTSGAAENSEPLHQPANPPAEVTWHPPTLQGITNVHAQKDITEAVADFAAAEPEIAAMHITHVEPDENNKYKVTAKVLDTNRLVDNIRAVLSVASTHPLI